MNNIHLLQERLRAMDWHGFVIPSTDEYLSEFAHPSARRLAWISGFSGSSGLAVVLQDRAALFLDGRYKSQGQREVAGSAVEVLDASDASKSAWLASNVFAGHRLAIDTRLQSHPDVQRLRDFAGEHGIKMVEASDNNPIDELWRGVTRPTNLASEVVDYPVAFAGVEAAQKCEQLRGWLDETGVDCHLLADPEDVAWLLNVRTHDSVSAGPESCHIVPIPLSRALLQKDGSLSWFVEKSRLQPALTERLGSSITVIDPELFERVLTERVRGKVVSANLRKTPYKFAQIAADLGTLRDDTIVARRRWKKHPKEIERAREGHFRDGQAVIRFLAWLRRTVRARTITEMEASQKLVDLRMQSPEYMGMSMPLQSASGASGAIAHYVPTTQSNRKLNDHPIYWMDSGGQYYGCSTDNTVCIAVGEPEPRHVRAHTLVLKGFIALSRARFPAGIYSTQLDSLARQYLWHEGMDYAHGTGHGVGNFMNIHEGPYIRKEVHHPLVVPMEVGMIVSNEPAYYAEGDFGIRIESHMVVVQSKHEGFLEFETLSRLPIDPGLIDKSLLTETEKQWLAAYHVRIKDGYRGHFDPETERWLQGVADSYVAMAL